MGPIATGLGEIYQLEVNCAGPKQTRSLMELGELPRLGGGAAPLLGVPGVIEVNALGGELKTYEVRLDPNLLQARGIAVTRVYEAMRRNNTNAGGGYIECNGEIRVIRGEGLDSAEGHGGGGARRTPSGTPIYIRDVGEVRLAP